jgi:hypothetical protein
VQQVEEAHHLGVAAAATAPSSGSYTATPASSVACSFCGKSGHPVERCFKFQDASRKAKDEVKESAARDPPSNPKR